MYSEWNLSATWDFRWGGDEAREDTLLCSNLYGLNFMIICCLYN